MTKTLTEQWREGTLDNGFYYVRSGWSAFIEIRYLGNAFFEGNIEVLAPVPSYSEYQALKDNCELTHTRLKGTHQKIAQLEKKLEIATKVLEHCQGFDSVSRALKEMEGVK